MTENKTRYVVRLETDADGNVHLVEEIHRSSVLTCTELCAQIVRIRLRPSYPFQELTSDQTRDAIGQARIDTVGIEDGHLYGLVMQEDHPGDGRYTILVYGVPVAAVWSEPFFSQVMGFLVNEGLATGADAQGLIAKMAGVLPEKYAPIESMFMRESMSFQRLLMLYDNRISLVKAVAER